jgi:transcription elongation factor Elf1
MGTGKQQRRQWHADNKDFVFDHFNGTCQICNNKIIRLTTKWDVHHYSYTYKGRLYHPDTTALELIENKIITLVCRPCHDKIHTAVDPEKPQHLQNSYPCDCCGRLEKGVFDRKKSTNSDRLLCRKCFLDLKKADPAQTTLF